jgi:NAD(P)-dependent dehydrogenase (short-subunit alcohol dehydrogenase family)
MRIDGKCAIVTGAGSGMGREGALLFARSGARVVAVDVDEESLASLVTEIRGDGGEAYGLALDLSRLECARRLVPESARLVGAVDILWSHAGMNGPTEIEAIDMELYERTLRLNLTAAVIAAGAAAGEMRTRGGGSIVLTSSVAGLVGSIQSAVYSMTKFGLVGLAKSLALRFAKDGIRVNAICPGPIDSPMLQDLVSGRSGAPNGKHIGEALLASIPMGRFGQPREVAQAALWLASDMSSFVTGVALAVDGGLTAR